MKYICEVCNTQYNSIKDAERCELAHRQEKAQLAAKAASEAKINEAVNAYIDRYKEIPAIEITDKNREAIEKNIIDKVEKTFNILLDLFNVNEGKDGGDEECKNCECYEKRSNITIEDF